MLFPKPSKKNAFFISNYFPTIIPTLSGNCIDVSNVMHFVIDKLKMRLYSASALQMPTHAAFLTQKK